MRATLTLCLLLAATLPAPAQTPFSLDSALAHLRVLSVEIGPRPMGSPGEQAALDYAVRAFRSAGCAEAYVMPMTVAGGVNTTSGVAVGVLPGKTGRIIVIGGHIDSSDPEVPGTCDDGSGVACVLELARVLAGRQNASTLLFCCWGGEEQGLRGSRHFVETFAHIDSVALMLQLDMADGSSTLEVFCDGDRGESAPRWLTSAAFEAFYDELPYAGLRYTTHTSTLNAATGSGAGSDHMPFLQRGIPAIAFVSDIGYPIHSPLDNFANFTPSGLKRSGDLVYKLVERFDGGTPGGGPEAYYLLQVGNRPVFVGHNVLWAAVASAFVAALGALALIVLRRAQPGSPRIRWSGLKVLLLTVVVMGCALSAETVLGLLRGYRFPWVNSFGLYVLISAAAGVAGLWVALRMARGLRLAGSPGVFFGRAIILLALFTAAALFAGVEVALYPATALLCVSLAGMLRHRWASWILVLLAPLMPLQLVFLESLEIMLRSLAGAPIDGIGARVLYNLVFILIFSLLALPFAYAFVGAARLTPATPRWLRWFPTRAGLGFGAGLLAVLSLLALTREVYGPFWYRTVRAEQRYTMGEKEGLVVLTSGEYLDGLRLSLDGRDTLLEGRDLRYTPGPSPSAAVPWLQVSDTVSLVGGPAGEDSAIVLERALVIRSALRPLSVRVTYGGTDTVRVSSAWSSGGGRRASRDDATRKSYVWFSYPEPELCVPVRLTLSPRQRLTETVEVTYDTLALPFHAERELTSVIARTVVTRRDTLGAGL